MNFGLRSLFRPAVPRMADEVISEIVRPSRTLRSPGSRYFAAAHLSRTSHFSAYPIAYNRDVFMNLAALRMHSRDLSQNNPYARNYLELVSTHIVGDEGVVLESKVEGYKGLRDALNKTIEKAWEDWSRCVTCDGRLSLVEVEQQVAQAVARDGECFIVQHFGFPDNKYGYALEILDATQVDWMHEVAADPITGVRTQMGIQHDKWGRALGYWVFASDPTDYQGNPVRTFVKASNIIHIYREDRVRGIRGIPWMTASMPTLNLLGQLLNAELAAAIDGANRVGVIEGQDEDDSDTEQDTAISEDPRDTAQEMTSDELSWLGLAPGQKASFAPSPHPNPHLGGFCSTLLHAIAASNQVAYHSLTGDVSQANYASSRVALLNERDCWKKLQKWFIKQCLDPIYASWLRMAVMSGQLKLPIANFEDACKPHWWARSWSWIDPENETKASIMAIRAGLSTHAEELGQQGRNWRRTFEQLAVEQKFQRDLKVNIDLDLAKGSNIAPSDLANPESVQGQAQNPASSVQPNAPQKPAVPAENPNAQ